jgi:hypothetical protein
MTNPKIAPWQAIFRIIDESGYTLINFEPGGPLEHISDGPFTWRDWEIG